MLIVSYLVPYKTTNNEGIEQGYYYYYICDNLFDKHITL